MIKENQFLPDYAIPPGETLLEEIKAKSITKEELSLMIGISQEWLNEIIKGNAAITPEIALKLESVFQLPAHFWINLEQQYQETLEHLQASKDKTKPINELISSARYLVNTSGSKTDVVLPLAVWKKLLILLEELNEIKLVNHSEVFYSRDKV